MGCDITLPSFWISDRVAVKAGHATRIANEEGNVSAVTAGADSRICCLADRHEDPRHKMTTDLNACSGIPRKGTFDSTKGSRFIEYVSSYRGLCIRIHHYVSFIEYGSSNTRTHYQSSASLDSTVKYVDNNVCIIMKPMRTQHGRNLYVWSMFKTLKVVGRFLYRSNTFIVLTI